MSITMLINLNNFLVSIKLPHKPRIPVIKLAGGEQHFMLFADGKSTRDRRKSVAREV